MITGDGALNAMVIGAIVLAGAAAVGAIGLAAFIRAARDRARTIIEPDDALARPGIGDDIHADGTPYSEAEIERMIRDYYQAGDL